MKKLIAIAVLSVAPFASALADQDVGCGAGSILFEGQSGVAPKILASTTNGSSGNQTFGITFGTLGCESDSAITSRQKLSAFIDGNMDNLARDIAKGEGETLSTLAAVWGMNTADQAEFATLAQANFAEVFSSNEVTSKDVFNNLNALVAQDEKLAGYKLV